MIKNATDWENIVDIAIPFTPKAGKINNPKIRIGFSIKLIKKDNYCFCIEL